MGRRIMWWALSAGAAVVVALWAGSDLGHGGIVTWLVTGGLLLMAGLTAAVVAAHRAQGLPEPRMIEAPRRLALPAPAPAGEIWTDRAVFTLAPEEPDAEPEPEPGPDPCDGPACDQMLPERVWTAGSVDDPDNAARFCSEECQQAWVDAGLWRPAGRGGRR